MRITRIHWRYENTKDAGDLEYLQVKAYDILTDYHMKGRTK